MPGALHALVKAWRSQRFAPGARNVLQADAGTRTASITGGYVALQLAIEKLLKAGKLKSNPIRETVAAISVGIVGGQFLVDLDYEEDQNADADLNVVMTESGTD